MTTTPKLNFTAETWQQLNYMCKRCTHRDQVFRNHTSGGQAVVTDLWFPQQTCTAATVEFDDEDIAAQIDELQTHTPWMSASASGSTLTLATAPTPVAQTIQTFSKVLGHFDWAVMAILAKGGKSYARIKHDAPAGITDGKIEYKIPMGMYSGGYEEWDQILADKVSEQTFHTTHTPRPITDRQLVCTVMTGTTTHRRQEEMSQMSTTQRFDGILDPNMMYDQCVVIIGVGAVGNNLARIIAGMNPGSPCSCRP